jgi:hypothetical protein
MALPVVYPVNPVHPVCFSSPKPRGPNQFPIRAIRVIRGSFLYGRGFSALRLLSLIAANQPKSLSMKNSNAKFTLSLSGLIKPQSGRIKPGRAIFHGIGA